MSNREVAGLQALAQKHGGHLTTNPQTGLPEAGFLDNILPMVAGGALTAFTGIDPLTAGAIVGGITGLESKDLSKGLVAGLGAWGGSSMYTGLAGAGLGAVGPELSANAAANATSQGLTEEAYNEAVQNQVASQLAEKNLAAEGATQLFSRPGQTLATMGGGSMLAGGLPILAGLAPAITDYLDNPDEPDNAPAQPKGYIRKYALDPVTGQYKQVGVYEAGGNPNTDVTSEAGTAGAFGGVGQSAYQKTHGMADGGVANSSSDSSRIYDYLMGRGENPMQFTHVQAPQVDYNAYMPKPITPTTGILETPFDEYGNLTTPQRSGSGNGPTAEEREAALDAKSDYLSRPDLPMTMRDYWGLGSEERRLADADAAARNPMRGAIKTGVENFGIVPIGAKILDKVLRNFTGINLNPPPVTDLTTYNTDVANDLQRQAEATQQLRQQAEQQQQKTVDSLVSDSNAAASVGHGEPASYTRNSAENGGTSYGSVAAGYGGGSEAATGGLSTPHGFQHMAHGGISGHLRPPQPFYANGKFGYKGPQVYADGGIAALAQRYDDGGMTLPLRAQPINNLGSMHPKTLQAAYDRAVALNNVAAARKYENELGLRSKLQNPQIYADGGETGEYNLGSYSDGGRLLKGPGDGVSDDIPATIGHGQPARLADGEFVIPARIVSEIGNGSTDAGARELYKMMDRIQAGRAKTVGKDKVATNTKAVRHLPA